MRETSRGNLCKLWCHCCSSPSSLSPGDSFTLIFFPALNPPPSKSQFNTVLSLHLCHLSSILQIRPGSHCDALHIQHHRGTVGYLICRNRVVATLCRHYGPSSTNFTLGARTHAWNTEGGGGLTGGGQQIRIWVENTRSSTSSASKHQNHLHHPFRHHHNYHDIADCHHQRHMRPTLGTTSVWSHCIWWHWWRLTSLS